MNFFRYSVSNDDREALEVALRFLIKYDQDFIENYPDLIDEQGRSLQYFKDRLSRLMELLDRLSCCNSVIINGYNVKFKR